jgi:hypothetical protein
LLDHEVRGQETTLSDEQKEKKGFLFCIMLKNHLYVVEIMDAALSLHQQLGRGFAPFNAETFG